MTRFILGHLGKEVNIRGGRAGREEPSPPAAQGSYLRHVSLLDGSVTYVKVTPQVSLSTLPENNDYVSQQ